MILALTLIALFFLLLRLFLWKKGRAVAIDQYVFMLYRDAMKAKQWESVLPRYIHTVRLWPLPLFRHFITLLPDRLFKNGAALMPTLSLMRMGLILLWGALFIGHVTWSMALAGAIVFLSSPITIIQDNQLNARFGGALLFDFLVAIGFAANTGGSLLLILVMAAAVCTVFFLHCLTLQIIIICSFAFLFLGNSEWIIALLLGGMLALLLGYWKYALAHWDISSFWFRNRRCLSAHEINQSPIYGSKSAKKEHWKGGAFQLATLVGMCPWAVLLVIAGVPYWSMVCLIILLASFLIAFVPYFKSWGHGRNYTYYLISPVIYGLIPFERFNFGWLEVLLCGLAFCISFLSIRQYMKWVAVQAEQIDSDLHSVLEIAGKSGLDRFCCVPVSLGDQFTWQTGKKVAGIIHNYGFKWVEPYYPVYRHSMEQLISDWNLGGVLIQKSYWPAFKTQVDQSLFYSVCENEKYILLGVTGWEDGNRIPGWARNAYPELKDSLPDNDV